MAIAGQRSQQQRCVHVPLFSCGVLWRPSSAGYRPATLSQPNPTLWPPGRFLLPPYFPLVVRSVASLEGVALLVDPSFKLVSAGMPIVLHQLLSDRRPAARQLLRELLLGPGGALRMDDAAQQIMQVRGPRLGQAAHRAS